jgi:hypothetical protein
MAEITYDILITYRDRETHLKTLVPQLHEHFKSVSYRITVIEQLNDFRFYKSMLYNLGINNTHNDVLVLSDVDYIPTSNVQYYDGVSDLFLPVYQAIFVDTITLEERPSERIPSGYRHFKNRVDSNFFGGVLTFTRPAIEKINGFNPLYFGWGLEDADVGRRAEHYGLTITRGNGLFKVLEHADNNPGTHDSYFRWNTDVYNSFLDKLSFGLDSTVYDYSQSSKKENLYGVHQWFEVNSAELK